jgi:phosphoribosylformylglycinamidine synthase
MAFAGGLGIHADLRRVATDGPLREDHLFFSETASRLLVTVHPEHQGRFEAIFAGLDHCLVGEVCDDAELRLTGLAGEILVRTSIHELKEAWQSPLREL